MNISGKRVFITGADGFIGSHLAEELARAGAKVKCLVYYNSWNSCGWLEDLAPDVFKELEIVFGDVRDAELMRICAENMDCIFHLSSLVSIPYSYRAARSFVQTNIEGALNICHAALSRGVSRVIHTSTSEVYGTAQYVPIDEKHPFQPQSPYSASKIAADMMALSFGNSFGLPVTVLRPFNTFGPRQTPRAVIPAIILQCLQKKQSGKPLKLGSLEPKRDFNYVKDTVSAFIRAAEADLPEGEVLNAATGNDVSIGEVLRQIMDILEIDLPVEQEEQRVRPEKSEVMRLCGDSALLRQKCGWKPEFDLETGLRHTIEWFRNRKNLPDSDRYWF